MQNFFGTEVDIFTMSLEDLKTAQQKVKELDSKLTSLIRQRQMTAHKFRSSPSTENPAEF